MQKPFFQKGFLPEREAVPRIILNLSELRLRLGVVDMQRQFRSADQVEMQVHDALTAVLTAVVDNAVAVLKSAQLCDLGNLLEDACNAGAVLLGDGVGTADMSLWDDEHVHGCFGCDILEGVDVIVLKDLVRGNLPCDYFTKQTIHFYSSFRLW